ncbi:MAG: hypothetical protein JRI96_17065, partial [Deltaproteobacteria bacterium]|nr:hypothetical protein [Deltaproteobacteria bacterium]
GIVAVHAGDGKVGYIHLGVLASFFSHDVHPPVPVPGLCDGVRGEIIFKILVFTGKEAVVAIVAL